MRATGSGQVIRRQGAMLSCVLRGATVQWRWMILLLLGRLMHNHEDDRETLLEELEILLGKY